MDYMAIREFKLKFIVDSKAESITSEISEISKV